MIRKLLLILLIPCALLFADTDDASIWIQMNNTLALNLDLSQTIALPNANTNWGYTGYNNNNYLAKIGSVGITDPVYLEVSCNQVDSSGHFIMPSASSNGLVYRTFKIGLAYRKSENGHKNYTPPGETTSFFSIDTAGSAPYPLPAATSSLKFSWIDFLIILDNYTTNGDETHLASANDYQCILTVTAHTADNRFSQSLSIPLMGYFESEPSEMAGECFLNLTNYGTVLDLRNMTSSDLIDVGFLDFSTISVNVNNKTTYDISISPSDIINDSDDFVMKRMSSTVNTYDETNSVPIRILLKGTTVVGTSTLASDLDSASTRSVAATKILQSATGTGESATLSYGYNAYVQVGLDPSYDTTNLASLISGQYYCDVYFFVTVNN